MNPEIDVEQSLVEIERFFYTLPKPSNLSDVSDRIGNFCQVHQGRPIVLITSGGTTVPVEHNTVRFVDNFSAGTRGSASAEYFLKNGYAVIFLHRLKSLEPFTRHLDLSTLISSISFQSDHSFTVADPVARELREVCTAYQTLRQHLLTVTFTTLSDYLFYLREVTSVLKPLGTNAMLYLAAAVSDFYIPPENMAKHKIQSHSGPLRLHFEMVPKILRPLIKYWVPDAFVISFKLETDPSILLEKARSALIKYGHKLVIANELQSRKHKVLFVTENNDETIETEGETEIEEIIVEKLIKRHQDFKSTFKSA